MLVAFKVANSTGDITETQSTCSSRLIYVEFQAISMFIILQTERSLLWNNVGIENQEQIVDLTGTVWIKSSAAYIIVVSTNRVSIYSHIMMFIL